MNEHKYVDHLEINLKKTICTSIWNGGNMFFIKKISMEKLFEKSY